MTKDALSRAPWYQLALKHLGTKEVPGAGNNPVIVDFWKSAKLAWIRDDKTPWCAGFVNAMLERCQIRGSRSAAARSFEFWGRGLPVPALGCIAVLKRPPNPWQGHVGFYAGESGTHICILGGNQGDAVTFAMFPKSRLLAYRWPAHLDVVPGRVAVGAAGHAINPSDR